MASGGTRLPTIVSSSLVQLMGWDRYFPAQDAEETEGTETRGTAGDSSRCTKARVRKAISGLRALDDMELVKSLVYESLRTDPPIPYQYATREAGSDR
ncbi:hypothetical protein R1flu_004789 [Riccia fluitans]|uniref:Uncharacterized protein n=1 Tax=Riccia fluitans TaxID=41844 RepID=A0ABD1YS50_9MARC